MAGGNLKNMQKLVYSLKECFEVSVCCLEKDILSLCSAKNFDLIIITDCSLKKTTGIALIKKVKEVQPDIKSILVSSQLITDEGKLRRSGINALIKRPFNLDALRKAIELVLG